MVASHSGLQVRTTLRPSLRRRKDLPTEVLKLVPTFWSIASHRIRTQSSTLSKPICRMIARNSDETSPTFPDNRSAQPKAVSKLVTEVPLCSADRKGTRFGFKPQPHRIFSVGLAPEALPDNPSGMGRSVPQLGSLVAIDATLRNQAFRRKSCRGCGNHNRYSGRRMNRPARALRPAS
jgi:hypothetical protein